MFFQKIGFIFPLVALSLALNLLGCAGKPVDENDPAALFKEAEEEIKGDHYQIAIEKLRVVKNKFPYSKFSIDAELRIADIYFLQESWGESAVSYESFRDLHPKHEKTAYAMFRVGKSYLNDVPGNVARDLTSAQKAVDAYGEFIKRFPNDGQLKEAQTDVSTLRKTLAEKELYIGNFYLKRDFLDSARPRFKKIIDLYPETPAATEAKAKIAKIDSK
ncbi:outer membrane protein assembly factor BamD [Bdellovibrionota bacterium FG-2]